MNDIIIEVIIVFCQIKEHTIVCHLLLFFTIIIIIMNFLVLIYIKYLRWSNNQYIV